MLKLYYIFYIQNKQKKFAIKLRYCISLRVWNCNGNLGFKKFSTIARSLRKCGTFQRGIISIAFYWADLVQWNALKYSQCDYETLCGTNRESCLFKALYWTVTKWNRDTRKTTQFTEANLDLLHLPLQENLLA